MDWLETLREDAVFMSENQLDNTIYDVESLLFDLKLKQSNKKNIKKRNELQEIIKENLTEYFELGGLVWTETDEGIVASSLEDLQGVVHF